MCSSQACTWFMSVCQSYCTQVSENQWSFYKFICTIILQSLFKNCVFDNWGPRHIYTDWRKYSLPVKHVHVWILHEYLNETPGYFIAHCCIMYIRLLIQLKGSHFLKLSAQHWVETIPRHHLFDEILFCLISLASLLHLPSIYMPSMPYLTKLSIPNEY